MSRTFPVPRKAVVLLVVGVIGLSTLALDVITAMDAGPAPEPVTHSRLIDRFPGPVSCLVGSGFSPSCLRPSRW